MSALRKYHIPLPGALLALLAFFLPWMSVGCQGILTVEASGYDLASGSLFSELDSLLGGGSAPVDPGVFRALWLIPVAVVIALVLVAVTMRRPEAESRTGLGHILAGLVGLAGLLVVWLQTRGETGGDLSALTGELVEMKYGLWLTVAGLLIIVGGGLLSYLDARRRHDYYEPPEMYGGVITQTTDSGRFPVDNAGPALNSSPTVDYSSPPTTPEAPVMRSAKTEVLNRAEPIATAWLVIKEGPRTGHSFRLLETTSIGRDANNDIIIDDTSLSGQHAKVKFEGGNHYVIYDLASTNGMFSYDSEKQDWERTYRYELSDGQQVKLGRTILHFMSLADKPASGLDAAPQS
ncbi:MAG: FHA domain-containing protein [Anaerolineales bacterium]|uniref:FHA domain-containing protein n=1 Tax=Promineifilum sp. TaxID=2664178 RepID=UPI001D21EB1D|nr:FHA domain-containing protein [Anaerolineales bacterium]MCO5181868.1 FHA domain-containing protein [Promineifilum sp.]